MKVASIVGARPNFIKLAPLSRQIRAAGITEQIIHTGQHYDYEMDRIFFEELGIPSPDHHLGVGSGPHGRQTGQMLSGIEKVLLAEPPDFALVFGDTNTTLAGALAAAKLHIPVAHVEAGLRSFDRRMPEEVNRIVTDHCSTLLFCPTRTAVNNLRKEGISQGVHLTGDVMVDILEDCLAIAERSSRILTILKLSCGGYLLSTLHRAENTDDPTRLASIVKALVIIARDIPVVFPCHPRTEARLKDTGLMDRLRGTVTVIPPVGYLDMLVLEKNARKILTDSGGVQKEACLLKVPCITLRDSTEWVETVKAGWNVLVGADTEKILEQILSRPPEQEKPGMGPKGASARIRELLIRFSRER
jgi:UDP-N-acetylglucosamine 2-epimerase (non-hydrolysing)